MYSYIVSTILKAKYSDLIIRSFTDNYLIAFKMEDTTSDACNFHRLLANAITDISAEQENIVRRIVNPNFFDVEAMVKYLNIHETISFEIFQTTVLSTANIQWTFLKVMKTISRDEFIRRIPIYFYDLNNSDGIDSVGDLFADYKDYVLGTSGDYLTRILGTRKFDDIYDYPEGFDFEFLYEKLVKVIDVYKVPLQKMFEYIRGQTGSLIKYEIFEKWYGYIGLVENLSEDNVFPSNILYAYNVELEKAGKEPIIYFPEVVEGPFGKEYMAAKTGTSFNIGGYFPCDENGEIAYKWVAVWPTSTRELTEEEKQASARRNKALSQASKLRITIRIPTGPETRVFLGHKEMRNPGLFGNDNEYNEYWEEAYCGPKIMKFDNKLLIKYREKAGYTPKDVSSGTGINIRTYQRIENGEGTPDGLNLMKIMNFLGIDSYEDLVMREVLEDPGFEKFKTGKSIKKFLDTNKELKEGN